MAGACLEPGVDLAQVPGAGAQPQWQREVAGVVGEVVADLVLAG